MIYLKYLREVIRHKWFVFQECCKLGVPWLGVIHDWTKFLPGEWKPYALSFNGPWDYDSRPQWLKNAFDAAWNHHQKRNKHHWQYWLLVNDEDGTYPLPMPDKYRCEMLADWRGAGRAYGNPDTKGWYQGNKDKIQLHPETREWIERMLT